MPKKGDIFDLGNNEYVEFIEEFDDLHDYVIHYTREPSPSLAELKLHKLYPKDSLDGELRKIGDNEKNHLASVYRRAVQKRTDGLDRVISDMES